VLHSEVSPLTLGLARVAVYGMWLWHVLMDPIVDLARFGGLMQPIGVLRLVPADLWPWLHGAPALLALKAVMLLGLAALVAGARPFQPLAALTCVVLVVYQGLVRSVGYISHGELAMLYAAIALAPFPCADALAIAGRTSVRRDPLDYRAPMLLAALTLCLTYSFVGARRLQRGGFEIFLDGTILNRVAMRGAERGVLGTVVLEHAWLARLTEVGFVVVSAFELLAPLALLYPWFRRSFLVVMLGFHVFAAQFMGISFRANLVLLAVFLTDSDRLVRAALARLGTGRRDARLAA